jgi:uncharacterized membrane protein
MLSPTQAIRQNGRNLLIITAILALILVVVGLVTRGFNLLAVHDALGAYGVKIQSYYGQNTKGISGTWFIGYESVEMTAVNVSVFGIAIGVCLGFLPLILMYNNLRAAIRRIHYLETQVKDD